MWTDKWLDYLENLEEDEGFGHNCWDDLEDTIKQFKKLEKLGAKILIYTTEPPAYNIRVEMPKSTIAQKNILSHILTKCPPTSFARWMEFKKKKMLDLEWHW